MVEEPAKRPRLPPTDTSAEVPVENFGAASESDPIRKEDGLYFFPETEVSETLLREILSGVDRGRRAWAISHLLRFAQWDDIWLYVDRPAVCELFDEVELPENLRSAWARLLKIETPVG